MVQPTLRPASTAVACQALRAAAIALAICVAAAIVAPTVTHAAPYTWSGVSGAIWDLSNANWTGATGNPWDATSGPTNVATFTSTSGSAVVSGVVTTNGLTYAPATSGTFLLTGGTIALGGGTSAQILNLLSGGSTGSTAASTLTIASTITSTTNFFIGGFGTTILSGSNSLAGTVTIGSGSSQVSNPEVKITNSYALDGASAVSLLGSGTNAGMGQTLTLGNGVTISGKSLSCSLGGIRASLQVAAGSSGTWNGNITGNSLALWANGTLTVGTGTDTSVAVASLRGSGTGVMNSALTHNVNYFSKTDAGTWIINSASNSFANTPTISSGVLQIASIANSGSNSSLGSGSAINIGSNGGNGTLRFAGSAGGSTNRTIAIQNGASGGGAIIDSAVVGQALTLSGNVTSSTSSMAYLQLTGSGNGLLSGTITPSGYTALNFEKQGSGTWTLSASNGYSGTSTVTAGSLVLNNAGALGDAAGTLVAAGGTLDLGGYTVSRSGTVSFTGGTVQNGTLSNSAPAFDARSGTVSAALAGSAGLTKTTSGTLTLSGSNGYSGVTAINAGTVLFSSTAALYGGTTANWTAANLTTGSGATAAFAVSGASGFTSANLDTLRGLGTGSTGFLAGSSFGIDTTGTSLTYASNITNPNGGANTLGLAKLGSGTLTLTGSNTYGPTMISQGVLRIGSNGTAGSLGTGAVTNNGNLTFNRTDAYGGGTVANAISGTGSVTLASGTLTLSGSNSYSGGTVVNAGVLQMGAARALGGSNAVVTVAAGAVLDLAGMTGTSSNPYSLTINGSGISGGGALVNTNNTTTATLYGPVTLASDATISGNGAGLILGDSSNGGGIGGNYVLTTIGFNGVRVYGNVQTASVTVAMGGSGNLRLESDNSFAGGLTIKGGSVVAKTVKALGGSGTGTVYLGDTTGSTDTFLSLGANGTYANPIIVQAGNTGVATLNNYVNYTVTASGTITLNKGLTLDSGNAPQSLTVSGPVSGVGGLTIKSNGSKVILSGSNSFTDATTINAGGLLSFASPTALASTSGVSIAGGGGLTYTGAANLFDRNITVTSGTGTVTNNGTGTLTLSGSLSKNGTVLRLTGGSFNVTGLITGTTVSASDLIVDASAVTLSNTNTYNGPTYVYNSGTLSLGIDNAIPNTSVVYLGNATTRGTLATGTSSDAISQLVFSGSGGTLSLSGDKTAAAQLATGGSLTLGSNADLVLTNAGTSAGLYRLISFTSSSGSFANISGTSAAYQVITTSTSIDYQQRAVLGAVNVTNPAVSILTGGSAAFTYTVANSAFSGGANLGFSSGSLVNLVGTSSGTATAGSSSGSISGLVFTGTTVGANQQGTFTVNAPTAYGATAATGTVSVNVLDHGQLVLSSSTISLGNAYVDYRSPLTATLTGNNAAGYRVAVSGSATPAGGISLSSLSNLSASSTGTIIATLATGGSAGAINQSFNYVYGDGSSVSSLSGYQAITGTASITVTGALWNPAAVNTITPAVSLGNVHVGGTFGTSALTIQNTAAGGSYTESLGATATPIGQASTSGSVVTLAGGSTSTAISIGLGGSAYTGSAGVKSGSATIAFTSMGGPSSATINSQTVAITGNVYSGQAVWNTNGGGNWGTLTGTGASAFGANWGTDQGSPGLDAAFANTDTATFGSARFGGTATIDLTGVTPSLKTITFNTGSASYLLSGGAITMSSDTGTAGLNVLAGSHEIASNLTLASLTSVNTGSGASLKLSGAIDGSGGFVKAGVGTLNVVAANTYLGNTDINAGTLKIFNARSFGSGTVTLASGATLDLDNLTIGNKLVNLGGTIVNSGSYTGTQTVSGTANYNGSTAGTIDVSSGGSATFSGPVSANVTLNAGASASVSGAVASTAVLTVSASSTLTAAQGASFAMGSTITNDGQFNVNTAGATPIASDISGSGLLAVSGGGLVQLTGANSGFTGQTTVSGSGTQLAVNSALGSTSVSIDAGAILGGSGSVAGVLSGAGLVSPGNSPGILTASQFDPTSGLGAKFEFTQSGSNAPAYDSPTASLNDVLHLTNTTPFVSNLANANHIDVYFNVDSIAKDDIFEGGFFTGLSASDLLVAVKNATFTYWVKDSSGTTYFNGSNYSLLTSLQGITGAKVTTVDRTANFGSGDVTGSVTQFVIIPEPDTIIFAGIGIAMAGWSLWKRRRLARILRRSAP